MFPGKLLLATLLGIFTIVPLFSEDPATSESSPANFGFELGIGVQTFPNPVYSDEGDPQTYTYQSLRLSPNLQIGKLGVGLDVTLHYTFTGDHNTPEGFAVRQEDWIPEDPSFRTVMDLYLPKIRYVSWGLPQDPLYVSLGNLPNINIGNGFIVNNYSNSLFFPERRFFGGQLNLDGSLLNFPLIGFQGFSSNFSRADVAGFRLFTRPMIFTDNQLLQSTQIGISTVFDFNPYFIAETTPGSPYYGSTPELEADEDARAFVWGLDLLQPILNNPVISLAAYGDIAVQNQALGAMIGTSGRLLSILPFTAQIHFLGDNFQAMYFNRSYDVYRLQRYSVYSGETEVPGYIGWLAGSGLSIAGDLLVFSARISGAFPKQDQEVALPELEANLTISEGLLPGLSAQAYYQKKDIASFGSLISPEDAVIGSRINYRTGPAVISLRYDIRYEPGYTDGESSWQINSGLETSLSF
ncbi:hypothetical protein [Spirochaeta dissipatitropha]